MPTPTAPQAGLTLLAAPVGVAVAAEAADPAALVAPLAADPAALVAAFAALVAEATILPRDLVAWLR